MIEVVPAIIPESLEHLQQEVSLVRSLVSCVQIDIADGVFAPTRTWPLTDWESFAQIAAGDEGLPYWKDIQYEAHLMLQFPHKYIKDFIEAGVSAIIVHASTIDDPKGLSLALEEAGVGFGLAITPTEYESTDQNLYQLADFIQVMGSDQIGYHGVKLEDQVYTIINKLSVNLKKPIAVDIGVNEETAPRLVEAGATKLVSGSAIYNSEDIQETINKFQNL
jgi:ribulose-phosphate 3-epimerase